jgi:hypothetical protein
VATYDPEGPIPRVLAVTAAEESVVLDYIAEQVKHARGDA